MGFHYVKILTLFVIAHNGFGLCVRGGAEQFTVNQAQTLKNAQNLI
jgi:hypothetical protein